MTTTENRIKDEITKDALKYCEMNYKHRMKEKEAYEKGREDYKNEVVKAFSFFIDDIMQEVVQEEYGDIEKLLPLAMLGLAYRDIVNVRKQKEKLANEIERLRQDIYDMYKSV